MLTRTGRTDLGVDPKSVDISTNPPCSDIDDFEASISRQFAYFTRNVRNIRLITEVSHRLKKKKDWGADQELVAHNALFKRWPDELPKDLQVSLPPGSGIPSLPSHFLGNMHSHYQLALVMLHRPQLSASQSFANDSTWRHHMSVCYTSAKVLCRLQEGILAKFDLTGLLCMQRGINFTIYAILTCIMIHLIALSSPDAEFNAEARDYFVRHMRILERCVSAWPMPETEVQINALRAAFSADVHRPFELKESFPLGSPSDQSRPSPVSQPNSYDANKQPQLQRLATGVSDLQQPQAGPYLPQHINQMNQMRGQTPYLATPPVSAYSSDSKPPTPIYPQNFEIDPSQQHSRPISHPHQHYPAQNMPPSAGGYYQPQPPAPTSAPDIHAQWNPTPIIDQFDTAFAIPPSALAPPPSMYGGSRSSPPGGPGGSGGMQNLQASFTSTSSPTYPSPQGYLGQQQQQQQQAHYFAAAQQPQLFHDTASPVAAASAQQLPSSARGTAYTTSGAGMFVTPRQWQQSVANVMDTGGLKRRWDFDQ